MNGKDSSYNGLLSCHFKPGSNTSGAVSYCWLKACQLGISSIFAIACSYELYKQVKVYGWKLQWRFFALVFMILSLLTNVSFCLWNTVYSLYSIQSYLYSLYYVCITGYVVRLYMKKNGWDTKQQNNNVFTATIVLMGILYTSILIDSIVQQPAMVNKSCQQIWYLCVNVICLALCLVALFIVFLTYLQQSQRLLVISYSQTQKIHNPFKALWIWIGFNTLAQIVDLIETGLLIGTTHQQKCMIIKNNQVGNNILVFFFAVFTLIVGYAATLYYFYQLRKSFGYVDQIDLKRSITLSQDLSGSYGVQMFHTFLQGLN